jgi:hypothetical protein
VISKIIIGLEDIKLLYAFLGWSSAILSQTIIEKIKVASKRRNLKILVFSELKDIGFRLASVCSKLQTHLGIKDREAFERLRTIYKKFGPKSVQKDIQVMDEFLKATDDQIKTVTLLGKSAQGIGLSLKKYALFSTGSILENLYLFDSEFQRDILDIKFQMNVFNEEIDSANFYHRLTFDPAAMGTNGDLVRGNLSGIYKNLISVSTALVNKIEILVERN